MTLDLPVGPVAIYSAAAITDAYESWLYHGSTVGDGATIQPQIKKSFMQHDLYGLTRVAGHSYAIGADSQVALQMSREDTSAMAALLPEAVVIGTDGLSLRHHTTKRTERAWAFVPLEEHTAGQAWWDSKHVTWVYAAIAEVSELPTRRVQEGNNQTGYPVVIQALAGTTFFDFGKLQDKGIGVLGLHHFWKAATESLLPVVGSTFVFTNTTGGTRITDAGVIETIAPDLPRWQGGGLLMEPQRTNYFENGSVASGIDNVTVTTGISDPTGSTSARRYTETINEGIHRAYFSSGEAVTQGVDQTFHIYLRDGGRGTYLLKHTNSSAWGTAWSTLIDLANAEVVLDTNMTQATRMTALSGGWYHIELHPPAPTAVGPSAVVGVLAYNEAESYVGDTDMWFDVWQPQFEAGEFDTSVIETSAGAVMRTQDNAEAGYSKAFDAAVGLTVALLLDAKGRSNLGVMASLGNTTGNALALVSSVNINLNVYTGGGVGVNGGGLAGHTFPDGDELVIMQIGTALDDNARLYVNGQWREPGAAVDLAGLDGQTFTDERLRLHGAGYIHKQSVIVEGLPSVDAIKALMEVA